MSLLPLRLLTQARATLGALVVREILRLLGALVFEIPLCLIFYNRCWRGISTALFAIARLIRGCTRNGALVLRTARRQVLSGERHRGRQGQRQHGGRHQHRYSPDHHSPLLGRPLLPFAKYIEGCIYPIV